MMIKKMTMKDYYFLQDYLNKNISKKRRVEYINGFLASIVSAPNLIKPSEWLKYVLADNDNQIPDYNSMDEANEVLGLIMGMYNDIAESINNKKYKPLYSIEKEKVTIDDAKLWCKGFVLGMNLWDKKSYNLNNDKLLDLITPILLISNTEIFINELNKKFKNKFKDEKINELKKISLNKIGDNVVNIRYYFLPSAINETNNIISKSKINRNEPCPCGSGKKYKKCCGD